MTLRQSCAPSDEAELKRIILSLPGWLKPCAECRQPVLCDDDYEGYVDETVLCERCQWIKADDFNFEEALRSADAR